MTTSREQFEQAAATKLKVDKSWIEQERDGEHYKSRWDSMSILHPLSDWWEWWQASRAALVVDLPQREPDNGTDAQVDISAGFANRMLDKCAKILRAAGITVKGDS